MLDKSKNYLIVGLGLLGGKYAQVLSQKGYNVTGITHSQATLDYALQHDYIRAGKNADFEDLIRAPTASCSASIPPFCWNGSRSTANISAPAQW